MNISQLAFKGLFNVIKDCVVKNANRLWLFSIPDQKCEGKPVACLLHYSWTTQRYYV